MDGSTSTRNRINKGSGTGSRGDTTTSAWVQKLGELGPKRAAREEMVGSDGWLAERQEEGKKEEGFLGVVRTRHCAVRRAKLPRCLLRIWWSLKEEEQYYTVRYHFWRCVNNS